MFLTRKYPYKSSDMTSWHQKSAEMTPHVDFAWKCARYAIFRCFNQLNVEYTQKQLANCTKIYVPNVFEVTLNDRFVVRPDVYPTQYIANFYRVVRSLVDFSLGSNIQKAHQKCENMAQKCEKLPQNVNLSYDVGRAKIAQQYLDSNFWKQIPDFTTRLIHCRAIKILHIYIFIYIYIYIYIHIYGEFFIAWSGYQPGCENLEFCTKIGIQNRDVIFLRVWRHKKRFAVILTYFFALFDRFSYFWHVFCQFYDQAEIH